MVTIGTLFVPLLASAGAALWAFISPSKGLYVAMVALAVFMMAIWSGIGLIWLGERKRKADPVTTINVRDCNWGLGLGDIMIVYDPFGTVFEWQFKLPFFNYLDWPIKVVIEEIRIVAGDFISLTEPTPHGTSFIIAPRLGTSINNGSFRPGVFSIKTGFAGDLFLRLSYGHPGDGFSCIAVIDLGLDCQVRNFIKGQPGTFAVSKMPRVETHNAIATVS